MDNRVITVTMLGKHDDVFRRTMDELIRRRKGKMYLIPLINFLMYQGDIS